MAVLESRQVVAWSIPTLALVVSLLWLRRRYRSRDPPTSDPGGPPGTFAHPKPIPVESSPLLSPVYCYSVEGLTPSQEESSQGVEVKEEEKVFLLPVQAESLSKVVSKSISEAEKEPVLLLQEIDLGEKIFEGIQDIKTEALETEELKEFHVIPTFLSFPQKYQPDTEVKKELSIETPNESVSLEDSEKENLALSVLMIEGDTSNINLENQNSEVEKSLPYLETEVNHIIPDTEFNLSSLEELVAPGEVSSSVLGLTAQEEEMTMEKGVLEEKLASLVLDTMKLNDEEGKQNAERDSANQSPSEVMLASPSISNFSDAHSEGSSDSGKGHSDVATSPSRTPAGGSSLAGDSAFSIYEFVLPQVMVGRLIGRHGSFIHEIRTSTHTNIFIKRHPDTSKLKICAIEGTQQDIDKALTKIRQKFPLRRFPKLTLEKVSFISVNNPPALKPEDFHLALVEGVNNDVILSSLITAAHFFVQQPSHPTYSALSRLNQVMNSVYSNADAPILETPVKDAICAAPTMGGWYRAQIVSVDEENQKCDVRFVDYGGYLTFDSSYLRQIRGDLLMLPFQAVECYLANVVPAGEDWTEEARLLIQSLTHGQLLQAQIYDYAEDGTPLVYLYSALGSQILLINEELVARGFATITTPAEE